MSRISYLNKAKNNKSCDDYMDWVKRYKVSVLENSAIGISNALFAAASATGGVVLAKGDLPIPTLLGVAGALAAAGGAIAFGRIAANRLSKASYHHSLQRENEDKAISYIKSLEMRDKND